MKGKGLKYLDFVRVAAIQAVMCFASVYEFAKENAGPLKPGVQTVESAVRAVVGPVYDRLHDVPFELLKFVDRKVRVSPNLSLSLWFRVSKLSLGLGLLNSVALSL